MQRTRHASNNDVLGAPGGWERAGLTRHALPITRAVREGQAVVQSYWKPAPAELKQLQAGGLVSVTLVGVSHAPMVVEVAAA